MQGLITNNVSTLYQEGNRPISIYAVFMNPKSRVITDALVIRPENGK